VDARDLLGPLRTPLLGGTRLHISAEAIRVSVRALDVHLTDLGEKREAGIES
jgi:hypothetical protein